MGHVRERLTANLHASGYDALIVKMSCAPAAGKSNLTIDTAGLGSHQHVRNTGKTALPVTRRHGRHDGQAP
jgi:hypothetical protein